MLVKRGWEEVATISTDFLGERTPLSRQLTTPPYLRYFLDVIFGFVTINALEPSHVSLNLNRMYSVDNNIFLNNLTCAQSQSTGCTKLTTEVQKKCC